MPQSIERKEIEEYNIEKMCGLYQERKKRFQFILLFKV